jgi:hypothetical protein
LAVNVPNPATYLANLGQHLVNLRSAINALVQDGEYLNAMGGAAFLEAAPFSLDTTDAAFIASNIGSVTSTNSTVEAIDSFLTATITLTGGN